MWRSIILIFFLPISTFASFPVEINLCQDTIVETKKETTEEYKIRIEKQLYSNSKEIDAVPNKNFLMMISGVLVALGLILVNATIDDGIASDLENRIFLFLCGVLFVGLGGILFLIDLIRRAVLSRSS